MTNAAPRLEKAQAITARISLLSEEQRKAARLAFLRHDMIVQDLQSLLDQADQAGGPADHAALRILLPAYEQSRRAFLTAVGEDPDSSDLLPSLMRARPCNA